MGWFNKPEETKKRMSDALDDYIKALENLRKLEAAPHNWDEYKALQLKLREELK